MFNQSPFNQTKFNSLQNNIYNEVGLTTPMNGLLLETDAMALSEIGNLQLIKLLSLESDNQGMLEYSRTIPVYAKIPERDTQDLLELARAQLIASQISGQSYISMIEQALLVALSSHIAESDTLYAFNVHYNELELLIDILAKTDSTSWLGFSEVEKSLVIVSTITEIDTRVILHSPSIISSGFNPVPRLASLQIIPGLSRIYPISLAVTKF
jgi:hypothetical protein